MGAQSKIEWTDASWNPIRARRTIVSGRQTTHVGWFCTHASEGCRNCYAEVMNRRLGTGIDYKAQNLDQVELFLDEKLLTEPLRWKRPRKIFVGSMTDLFGEFVPDAMIDRIFAVMALCPQHTFQVLTKRAERMREYVGSLSLRGEITWPLPNVWLGVSCEDQAAADERIPHLLATPAAIRFLSCEPLLGPIDAAPYLSHHFQSECAEFPKLGEVDWVICGGESGPHARPMHPDWARSLRDQCAVAGVPFFFKQWGEFRECGPEEGPEFAATRPGTHWSILGGARMIRVGKRAAGRMLDGRTHDEFPGPA